MSEPNGERSDIPAEDVRQVRRDGAAFLALALVTELLGLLSRKGLLTREEAMDLVTEALRNADLRAVAQLQADRAGVPAEGIEGDVLRMLLPALGIMR